MRHPTRTPASPPLVRRLAALVRRLAAPTGRLLPRRPGDPRRSFSPARPVAPAARLITPRRLAALVLPLLLASLPFAVGACASAGSGTAPSPTTGEARQGGQEEEPEQEGPQTMEEALPDDAVADPGLFTVHTNEESVLFEIPDSLLGREMLLISRMARVPQLGGYIPAGSKAAEQVLTWSRRGDRILLRKMSYEQVAADSMPISISVVNNNVPPIVASFEIEAEGEGGASVLIDVTDFFGGDTPAISGLSSGQRSEYGVRGLDSDRSFLEYARAYPENVEIRHTKTYEASSPPTDSGTGSMTLEMHQSMVLLPEEPMRPRYADDRVGFFSVERVNFGLDAQKAATETFIRRWRMEPRDPAAYARGELVEPVKPIVYYLDPATPTEWRSCVRQGVNDWAAAFETAGFRNAIRAEDPPSPAEDPEWDAADVRYSVIRWAASLTRNAQGPSVSDPRTGEIIESDIVWYHNHMRSYRNRLLLETGAANPAARSLPIDYDLMCEAMRQVIAHEVGHALGLPHNMVSSSAYPVDSLRVKSFAERMGVAPSIMDYARQNYIAQPGDGLEGADFIRQIGPYDHHAINWGYRMIPEAATPEEERPVLDAWIVEKAGDRTYKYLSQGAGDDPRAQTEDLGDDAVKASGYGIRNLQRVTPKLVEWTTTPGEDYSELGELYGELLGQWSRYVGHVVDVVGGVYADPKTADQAGPVFEPVPRSRQEAAVAFLAQHVFEAPTWLNEPGILARVDEGGFEELSGRQASVLGSLLSGGRLAQLAESEVTWPGEAYPLAAYLDDVRGAVWGSPAATAANPYRRALQRVHIQQLAELMADGEDGPDPEVVRSDIRPLVRAQLRTMRETASSAAASTPGAVARAHLEDVVERIDAILEEGGIDG